MIATAQTTGEDNHPSPDERLILFLFVIDTVLLRCIRAEVYEMVFPEHRFNII